MVYCEPKKSSNDEKLFDFKVAIPIKEISKVSEIKDPGLFKNKDPNLKDFCLSFELQNQTWILQTKSTSEKKEWMNDLIILVIFFFFFCHWLGTFVYNFPNKIKIDLGYATTKIAFGHQQKS